MKAGNIMSKKLLALAAVLLLSVQCAWADAQLWTGHYSVSEMADGHSDYSSARFYRMRITVDDTSRTPTQEYLNLKGALTIHGGTYSFINNKLCQAVSGTSQTLTLSKDMDLDFTALQYVPRDSEGNTIYFVMSADNGLNGVDVSWSFPDMPSFDGQGIIPDFRSTQQQLDSFVPYIEYIRSGSDVTGLKWRVVKPSDPTTPVSQDFNMTFRLVSVIDTGFYNLGIEQEEHEITAGETPEGTFMFSEPISASEIGAVDVGLEINEGSDSENYYWFFYNPIESASGAGAYLWHNHVSTASLVNGKADYGDAEFHELILVPQADRLNEAKYFTSEGSITIPGGGYALNDADTGELLGTVDTGKSMTFGLKMLEAMSYTKNSVRYLPTNDDGRSLYFAGDISGLRGKTVTLTFPSELNMSGSAVIPNIKTTSEQLAEGVPYIELVSGDVNIAGVKWKLVKAQDTSTPVSLPYKTDFLINIYYKSGYINSPGWQEDYDGNEQSYTFVHQNTDPTDTISVVSVRIRTWEDPDNPCLYQWNFYPAEASEQSVSPGGSSSSCNAGLPFAGLALLASLFILRKH